MLKIVVCSPGESECRSHWGSSQQGRCWAPTYTIYHFIFHTLFFKYLPAGWWWFEIGSSCRSKGPPGRENKHCQRHNGPEDWVHLAKVASWSHIKSSNINLDHIPSSESRICINKKSQPNISISTKLKFKILTKPSFRISTKIQLHNLYKTSAAKWWTNSSFKILPELQLQNLDQPCAQSLNKSLALGPNVSSQICNKLLPTWSSASTWATVTTSTSFELASSHARVTSIKFTKQQLVSEWVS